MSAPSLSSPALAADAGYWRDDARTIGLIGLAHGSSHFFHLMLPPLFPWFIREFGLNYTQLGALVSVFFVVSGTGQALAGFVVDKVGARPVLFAALSCFALAALTAALAPGYSALMLAAALAGLGNSPFHPVDFTILNHRVSHARLGHAYSVHGISGNLGWAAAPLFLTGLTAATGSWRLALAAAALWALLVLALLVWQRSALADRPATQSSGVPKPQAAASTAATGQAPKPAPPEHPLAFLKLGSVWLCFSFFFTTTCALSAIQSFAAPALTQLYGLPAHTASLVVSGYMLCGAAGMVVGGFLMARTQRLERIIGICLLLAAALLLMVGQGWLPGAGGADAGLLALCLTAAAGIGTGLAGPSRDMLIKQAAPPGATGRVYGMVYSGLDLGFAMAAPVFGRLMDRSQPGAIFTGAALALTAGILCASAVGMQASLNRQRAARR